MLQSGSGPLVLFLHGANGLPQWLPFFERLATQFDVRFRNIPVTAPPTARLGCATLAISRCTISISSMGSTAAKYI